MKILTLTITSVFFTLNVFAQNWVLKNSNTIDDIVDIYFKNETLGFFLTNTGKLYKTNNSGENWSFIIQDIDFVDTLNLNYPTKQLEVVTTSDSVYCYSSNISGSSNLTIRLSASLINLNFVKDTLFYRIKQPQFWNNEVWTVEKVNQEIGLNVAEEYNIFGNYISALGATQLYFSNDFGITWNTKQFTTTPLSSQPYQSFYNGSDTLIAVTNYPTTIHKSFDNGSTWTSIQPSLNGIYLYFLNSNDYLAYNLFGGSTKVYSTNNGGNSINEELLTNVIKGIYSLNNNFDNIYVFGKNGMLYKSTNGGGLVSTNFIENKKNEIVLFPNPSGDYLNIINKTNFTLQKVVIYDNMGKGVFDDEQKNDKIDISSLIHGTYYITLIFNDNEKTTLKFIKK